MGYLTNFLIEEANAIKTIALKLDDREVEKALEMLDNCSLNNSKLIISGVGKSGIIARKIAATFSSFGFTAIYLNPLDALHGDIGIVNEGDLSILLSNSGETSELLEIIPHLKNRHISCISLSGNHSSSLAKNCDVFLNTKVEKESCPLNLAPTTSTTVTMAIGDALASAWMFRNQVSSEEFAFNHPGGSLGRKLTVKVEDVMINKSAIKNITEESSIKEVIFQISSDGIGCCGITGSNNSHLVGIITDGDLRRALEKKETKAWESLKAKDIMTHNPITIKPNMMAIDALNLMENNYKNKSISILPVTSEKNEFLGFLRLHDLIQRGL